MGNTKCVSCNSHTQKGCHSFFHIFDLCMQGKGPHQISLQLEREKILTVSAYKEAKGLPINNKTSPTNCAWSCFAVTTILERREYLGCRVNCNTYSNSIWDKRRRQNAIENQVVIPNTHPPIIEKEIFDKVQEIRSHRHRRTRVGTPSIFSGLMFCNDCGKRIHRV